MRSRRKSGKKQNSVFLIALSMVLFIIMCSACFGTIRAQAADETSAYKYYTSIQITPGQTLNDIAGIYMTDERYLSLYRRGMYDQSYLSG